MGQLQHQLCRLLLLTCVGVLLQTDICVGEHLVHIQEGPLYRVKGFPLSISCNVSGLIGFTSQEFTFSVYKATNPTTEINIISSNKPDYSYAVYSKRVREGSIVIEKLSGISVLFHIKSLEDDDAGTYECYTPNQYSTYLGTYSAQTTLNVIQDTLKASFSGPASHTLTEGESLQLECQVSSQTFQHTHLSVSWYLDGTTGTQLLIALDRDLTLRPGTEFENRYRAGLVTLEKIEDTTYRLRMSQLQQSDSGLIYCQAAEWIQDPDRSWIPISYKNTTGSSVEVKAQEIAPKMGDFITQIKPLNVELQEGDMMQIHCSIETKDLPQHFFSLAWLKDKAEVAQIGPTGALTVANNYMQREKEGEMRAVKKSDKAYVLTIQSVRSEDQGVYQCKASQEERTEMGTFNRGQSQLSPEEKVQIRVKESGLAVLMEKQLGQVTEGETFQISCNVSGANGLLSVSWQHKKTTSTSFSDVITLSQVGLMGAAGAQYQGRDIRTFRPTASTFILEISAAVVSDSGEYMCTVTDWDKQSIGKKVSLSQRGQLSVRSIDSLVNVVLRSRDTNITENSVIKLFCSVNAPKVPLTVTWKFQPLNSTAKKDILSMRHTGDISYGKEQQDYQLETTVSKKGTNYVLKVLRASRLDQGQYYCQADAYTLNVQKATKLSNPVAVIVHKPVSKLSLSTTAKSHLKVTANTNAKLDCIIASPVSNSSQFKVTWMYGTQTLLRMEPEGMVVLGPENSQEERIHLRRTDGLNFQLMIQQVKSTDGGTYQCTVQEWIQDPDGILYDLNTKSITMELQIIENASDFRMKKANVQLDVTEGKQLDLVCSLEPGPLDPTFRYSLTWFFEQHENQSKFNLLSYSHDGRLQFLSQDLELQPRLKFSRPTVDAFHLSILNSMQSDSGRYYCQVDRYTADCKGKLESRGSDISGFTNVNVHLIESKLQIRKLSGMVNVSDNNAGFTVECDIVSHSSNKSVFEVSWLKRQKDERPVPIFTVNQTGTLHSPISSRPLLYNRPSTNLFKLTVPDVDPSDNGLYQCQVVERLLTASNKWRVVARNTSGELSIYVHAEDGKAGPSSVVILGSLSFLIVLLLVVIIMLTVKVFKTKSVKKKGNDMLWAENNPLKQLPEKADDSS
ncbi:immunoglobulin superfamily member 2 [Trichomycterus rosablanca]|uniref:immunoglobulin superfamily member 2 n=1 Tax=Trichomycterus rosablanca TaxID=2290929 RepID=UPI002F35B802